MRFAVAHRLLSLFVVAAPLGAAEGGCARGEPPAPDASPSIARPELPPPVARAGASATEASKAPDTTGLAGAAAAVDAAPNRADGVPSAAATIESAPSPGTMTQTTERPQTNGAAFQARVQGLWEAIVRDDPAPAMPFFFPLAAYRVVKDVADPTADWKHRLVAAYERDIHELHVRLGAADRATLGGMDVPASRAKWVEPGEEWNKIGYFRVFGSTLRYSIDGREHALAVRSLISWRGEWYVVHLRGG